MTMIKVILCLCFFCIIFSSCKRINMLELASKELTKEINTIPDEENETELTDIDNSSTDDSDIPNNEDESNELVDTTEDLPPFYLLILQTYPENGAVSVAVDGKVSIFFNDNIAPSTINNESFILEPNTTDFSFTYNEELKAVSLFPVTPLLFDTNYSLLINLNLHNYVGETLEGEYEFSFTTQSAISPIIHLSSSTIELAPNDLLAIGNEQLGSTKTTTLTITNDGTAALDISSISLSSGDIADFTITSSIVSLAPDSSDSFSIDFTPNSAGEKLVTVVIDSNAENISPYEFTICGEGVAALTPDISLQLSSGEPLLDGASYDFGTIAVGETSPDAIIQVHNIGTDTLLLTDVLFSGKSDFLFSSSSLELPSPIAPESSLDIPVNFTPESKGNKKSDLIFYSDDPDTPEYTIAVKGRGV